MFNEVIFPVPPRRNWSPVSPGFFLECLSCRGRPILGCLRGILPGLAAVFMSTGDRFSLRFLASVILPCNKGRPQHSTRGFFFRILPFFGLTPYFADDRERLICRMGLSFVLRMLFFSSLLSMCFFFLRIHRVSWANGKTLSSFSQPSVFSYHASFWMPAFFQSTTLVSLSLPFLVITRSSRIKPRNPPKRRIP